MKRSLKKLKKTRLFFIISIVTQIASYAATAVMLYKKKKDAASIFAALGILGTICSIALWKYDSEAIVPKKLKDKMSRKKKDGSSDKSEEENLSELTDEEVEELLSDMELEEDGEMDGSDSSLDELKKAVDELSADMAADEEKEEI